MATAIECRCSTLWECATMQPSDNDVILSCARPSARQLNSTRKEASRCLILAPFIYGHLSYTVDPAVVSQWCHHNRPIAIFSRSKSCWVTVRAWGSYDLKKCDHLAAEGQQLRSCFGFFFLRIFILGAVRILHVMKTFELSRSIKIIYLSDDLTPYDRNYIIRTANHYYDDLICAIICITCGYTLTHTHTHTYAHSHAHTHMQAFVSPYTRRQNLYMFRSRLWLYSSDKKALTRGLFSICMRRMHIGLYLLSRGHAPSFHNHSFAV